MKIFGWTVIVLVILFHLLGNSPAFGHEEPVASPWPQDVPSVLDVPEAVEPIIEYRSEWGLFDRIYPFPSDVEGDPFNCQDETMYSFHFLRYALGETPVIMLGNVYYPSGKISDLHVWLVVADGAVVYDWGKPYLNDERFVGEPITYRKLASYIYLY